MFCSLNKQTRKYANTPGKSGFTLMEVMVATAVLSLGVVLIFESFFILLDSYNYYSNYLNLVFSLDENLWQAQDSIRRLGPGAQIDTNGKIVNQGKDFTWGLAYKSLDEANGLFALDLTCLWQEGRRKVNFSRTAYVLYDKKE